DADGQHGAAVLRHGVGDLAAAGEVDVVEAGVARRRARVGLRRDAPCVDADEAHRGAVVGGLVDLAVAVVVHPVADLGHAGVDARVDVFAVLAAAGGGRVTVAVE